MEEADGKRKEDVGLFCRIVPDMFLRLKGIDI